MCFLFQLIAVYHEPYLSVRALAYLSKSLSGSFVSTTMSDRYGLMCSAFQRSCVRKRSANRMAASVESSPIFVRYKDCKFRNQTRNEGGKKTARDQPSTDAEYLSRLDAPPFQRPSSTARPHRRLAQTDASPVMSPRVRPRARIRGIGTVLGQAAT
jgi:hypothetical protein